MTDADKIKELRRGIMCAVIHLFQTHPQDVCNMFSLEELETFASETEEFKDINLEGVYKDVLSISG